MAHLADQRTRFGGGYYYHADGGARFTVPRPLSSTTESIPFPMQHPRAASEGAASEPSHQERIARLERLAAAAVNPDTIERFQGQKVIKQGMLLVPDAEPRPRWPVVSLTSPRERFNAVPAGREMPDVHVQLPMGPSDSSPTDDSISMGAEGHAPNMTMGGMTMGSMTMNGVSSSGDMAMVQTSRVSMHRGGPTMAQARPSPGTPQRRVPAPPMHPPPAFLSKAASPAALDPMTAAVPKAPVFTGPPPGWQPF